MVYTWLLIFRLNTKAMANEILFIYQGSHLPEVSLPFKAAFFLYTSDMDVLSWCPVECLLGLAGRKEGKNQ